ncbi:PREDICTED: microphthalmia-associated transcription factor-like isoform X2 [Thamnophis sirtalis]|uniref:Microphthalmia-associated transcription factor-like isoform X2 n=1 Tax=Thamnophis sirtalis TaxID=35019 RepID=A0A6I9XQ38_9SAUR|nr:PREDICTED: microphthalmia-associated transcription factor-like isoform X2 [Thamnophis sirtalis]
MEALRIPVLMPCSFESHYLLEHPGASKPPLSSSNMTSRILLRQQLMREQMQEQERREQRQKQQAAQFMQQRGAVSQTPAINVSLPASLPPATQVPMEVLKVGDWVGSVLRRRWKFVSISAKLFKIVSCSNDGVKKNLITFALPVHLCCNFPKEKFI